MQLGFNWITDKKSCPILIYFQTYKSIYTEMNRSIKKVDEISWLKMERSFNKKVLTELFSVSKSEDGLGSQQGNLSYKI